MDYAARVAKLRDMGPVFEATMRELAAAIPAVRGHARASADLRALLNEGQGIRAGIRHVAKLVDAANRWIGKTFQTDAMESIPFAPEIVSTTAAASMSAIEHFQDRARAFLSAAQPAIAAFAQKVASDAGGVHEAAQETVTPEVPRKVSPWPAIALLAVLGGAIYWFHHSTGEPHFLD